MATPMSSLWEVAPEDGGHGRVSVFLRVARVMGRPRPSYEEPPDERRAAREDRQMIKAVLVTVVTGLFLLAVAGWL